MRRPRNSAGSLLLAACLLPATLAGQAAPSEPADGSGIRPATFWWDLSAGSGSLQVSCGICAGDVETGPFVTLAGGAYATPRMAVGVELGGWTHRDGEVREQLLQAGVTLRYGRNPLEGLHYLAGAGWVYYRADDFRYGAPQLQLGLGWGIPVFDGWATGARLLVDVAPVGSLKNGSTTVADGVRTGTLRLSLYLRRN